MAVWAHPLDSGNQLRFIERFEVLVLFLTARLLVRANEPLFAAALARPATKYCKLPNFRFNPH